MTTPITLHRWSTTRSESHPAARYMAPEQLPLRLQGQAYNDPRRDDGHHVVTSRIVSADKRIVTTGSGSIYRLGRPDQKWLKWLRDSGRTYDPKQPIKEMDR